MQSIAIGKKELLLPALVPSVSSFETQIYVNDAINVQNALYEPISLVSAYDIKVSKKDKKEADRHGERTLTEQEVTPRVHPMHF